MSAEARRRSRTDVAPRSFAWQAWHCRYLRLALRGRRGAFCATIEAWRRSRTDVAPRSFAWQAWSFLCHHRCQRKLGDEIGLMWRRGLLRGRRGAFGASGSFCVAGVVLSVPHSCQRKLGDEV